MVAVAAVGGKRSLSLLLTSMSQPERALLMWQLLRHAGRESSELASARVWMPLTAAIRVSAPRRHLQDQGDSRCDKRDGLGLLFRSFVTAIMCVRALVRAGPAWPVWSKVLFYSVTHYVFRDLSVTVTDGKLYAWDTRRRSHRGPVAHQLCSTTHTTLISRRAAPSRLKATQPAAALQRAEVGPDGSARSVSLSLSVRCHSRSHPLPSGAPAQLLYGTDEEHEHSRRDKRRYVSMGRIHSMQDR